MGIWGVYGYRGLWGVYGYNGCTLIFIFSVNIYHSQTFFSEYPPWGVLVQM